MQTKPISEGQNVILKEIGTTCLSEGVWSITAVLHFPDWLSEVFQFTKEKESLARYSEDLKHLAPLDIDSDYFIENLEDSINHLRELAESVNYFLDNSIDPLADNQANRTKRAYEPIAEIFKFLFGTATQSDINEILFKIETIRARQDNLINFVENQHTILQSQIKFLGKSHSSINSIIKSIAALTDETNRSNN